MMLESDLGDCQGVTIQLQDCLGWLLGGYLLAQVKSPPSSLWLKSHLYGKSMGCFWSFSYSSTPLLDKSHDLGMDE